MDLLLFRGNQPPPWITNLALLDQIFQDHDILLHFFFVDVFKVLHPEPESEQGEKKKEKSVSHSVVRTLSNALDLAPLRRQNLQQGFGDRTPPFHDGTGLPVACCGRRWQNRLFLRHVEGLNE